MRSHISILITAFLAVLVVASCTSDPTSVPAHQEQPVIEEGEPLARGAFFTGRDSFGVAFKAQVRHATLEYSSPEEIQVTGRGNATHMGRITVEQSLHVIAAEETGRDSIFGTLTFIGQNGQAVEGEIAGHIDPGFLFEVENTSASTSTSLAFDGTLQINEHSIDATKAEEDMGWASLTGTIDMDKQTMSYRLDGWLLHFVKETDGE